MWTHDLERSRFDSLIPIIPRKVSTWVRRLPGKLWRQPVTIQICFRLGILISGTLGMISCQDQPLPLNEKSVIGDLAPTELTPRVPSQPIGASDRHGSYPLFSDRAFAAASTPEPQLSTSVVYRFEPTQHVRSLLIPVEAANPIVFEVRPIVETSDSESDLRALQLIDGQSKLVSSMFEHAEGDNLNSKSPSRHGRRVFTSTASEPSSYTLMMKPEMTPQPFMVEVRYPETSVIVAAAFDELYYQPGQLASLEFQAISRHGEVELDEVTFEGCDVGGGKPLLCKLTHLGTRGGRAEVTIHEDFDADIIALRLNFRGRGEQGFFVRSIELQAELIRPHAEIVDLRARVNRTSRVENFEIDATIRSLNGDRFRLEGTLTGRSDAGYELPVAKAFVEFDMLERGLESAPLVFELSAVQGANVGGPFVLRDLILTSLYTEQVQHRIGLVDGVETPLRWGLAGNKTLGQTLCRLLAESGRLSLEECEAQ